MKSINPEFDYIELLFIEKLANFAQIFAAMCLGISYFLPLYTSANGEVSHADGEWGLFFWIIPALVIIHSYNNRWLKATLCFLSAIGGLLDLFLIYFLANFKSTPLTGFYTAQTSIVILVISWLTLSVTTLKIVKIQRAKTKIQTLLRYILLGVFIILIAFIAYQISWNGFVKTPVEESVDYKLPSDYYRAYSRYIGRMRFMHIVTNKSKLDRNDRPTIMIASMPSYVEVDEENIRLLIQLNMEWSSEKQNYEMKLIDEQEITIRGQKVSLLIYEGTDENGVHMKQVTSGLFEGKNNSKVILSIAGKVANWNQKEIDIFIESIK